MIKAMHKMLTTPIKKKYDSGGPLSSGLDWGKISNQVNGSSYAVQPSIVDTHGGFQTSNGSWPIKANIPTTVAPLDTSGAPQRPSFLSSLTSVASGLNKAGNNITPFASNIVNQFRTPPQPSQPHLDNPITLRAPSYDAERADLTRNMNADAEGAARTVDGNTGAKIRLFNSGQKLERLGQINERESNARIAVGNEQARINSSISSRNNEKLDRYGDEGVEREIALQRTRSENISNFSDKMVGMQNENAKRQVDLDKTKTLSTIFSRSGVGDRERTILKGLGVPDPMGMEYSDLGQKKANGGMMGIRQDHSRGFYKNLAVRGQTLKSLYRAPN